MTITISILVLLCLAYVFSKPKAQENDYKACFGNPSKYFGYFNKGFAIGSRALTQSQSHSHFFVSGASGSGKSVSIAIPSIVALARGKSTIIINDISGELWNYTSQYLADKGYEILRLNFSDSKYSESFNPLLSCNTISDIQKVAMMVVRNSLGESKSDPFWEQSAIMLISLFIRLQVFHLDKEYCTLHNTLLLIQKFATEGEACDRLIAKTNDEDLLAEYKAFLVSGQKTLQSIIATARTALHIFCDTEVQKTTAKNTIDFTMLRQKPTAIFLNSPLKDLEYLKPLTALFIQSLFNFVLARLPNKTDKHDIFFLIDEFPSYTFPGITVTICNLRKYAGMCIIMQDDSALTARYGQADANQIKTNCSVQCYLKGSPLRVCKELSQTLGNYTYTDEKGVKRTRELMTADEIRMTDACITIINNQPPLKFVPTPFYKSLRYRYLAKALPYEVKEKEITSPPRIKFE